MRHDVVRGRLPASARLLYVDRSLTLGEVINTLNKYSNNFMAETLIKTIGADQSGAPGTFDNGLAAVRYFLENEIGYEPGSYKLGNGSGLNHVNMFSSHHMVKLLSHLYKDFEIGSEGLHWASRNAGDHRFSHASHRGRDDFVPKRGRYAGCLHCPDMWSTQRTCVFFHHGPRVFGANIEHVEDPNAIGEALATDGASGSAHGDEEGVQTTKSWPCARSVR